MKKHEPLPRLVPILEHSKGFLGGGVGYLKKPPKVMFAF